MVDGRDKFDMTVIDLALVVLVCLRVFGKTQTKQQEASVEEQELNIAHPRQDWPFFQSLVFEVGLVGVATIISFIAFMIIKVL